MTRSSIPLLVLVPWMHAGFRVEVGVYGVPTRALREADRRRMDAYSVREKQGLVPDLQLGEKGHEPHELQRRNYNHPGYQTLHLPFKVTSSKPRDSNTNFGRGPSALSLHLHALRPRARRSWYEADSQHYELKGIRVDSSRTSNCNGGVRSTGFSTPVSPRRSWASLTSWWRRQRSWIATLLLA
jgi:hypothetical protein